MLVLMRPSTHPGARGREVDRCATGRGEERRRLHRSTGANEYDRIDGVERHLAPAADAPSAEDLARPNPNEMGTLAGDYDGLWTLALMIVGLIVVAASLLLPYGTVGGPAAESDL